ncbi:hypothetical protein Ade02nite_03600 [Paractinoplanes deccanensis]|uniref:Uncharacterized protein n=1 Tax=Paractinoplanes deccanensis TaxID=113561 RepID=A0ABQ3XVF2_9ACTN|nr:hypothetical protein [Actinoplanes deccanensis]GID71719.1 hypothetical protein Ade02nite_03600 [Actinoplanes deccanensis]
MSLWVAATGGPYPIRFDSGGTFVDLSGFGSPPPAIEEPAAADTVEMSAVLRSGVSAS